MDAKVIWLMVGIALNGDGSYYTVDERTDSEVKCHEMGKDLADNDGDVRNYVCIRIAGKPTAGQL